MSIMALMGLTHINYFQITSACVGLTSIDSRIASYVAGIYHELARILHGSGRRLHQYDIILLERNITNSASLNHH